jgi:prefoldin subunit 5
MSTHEEHISHESHECDPTRPHSFDLTLELERQLEAESLPTSPARPERRPQSLDTHVLSSLVTSLRVDVAELTKERDELSASLKDAHGREEDLTSEVRQLKEAQAERDTELATLRQKARDDEESIVLLRSKVEESRFGLSLLLNYYATFSSSSFVQSRGVMRLQSESRRISRGADLSVDLSRANTLSFGGPPSSKRMSFTPLTGTSAGRVQGHRRISSVSDSNVILGDIPNGLTADTSPNPQTTALPDVSTQLNPPPTSSRRISGLYVRTPALESEPGLAEREKLQREIQALKTTLEETRNDLMEANEAREASETCVRTLRDFITENNVGPDAGSAVARSDDADKKIASGSGGSRWGFGGLFRAGEANSPVISGRGVSTSSSSSPTNEALSRKLGGLFGGRGSFSSSNAAPPRGILNVQEAIYNNSSDTSSTAESAEPASPRMEISHMPITRVLSGTSSTSSELSALRTATEEKNGTARVVMV